MNLNKETKIYSRGRFCFEKQVKNKTVNSKVNIEKFIKVVAVLGIAIITFSIVVKSINPIINDLCTDKAKNIATIISNEEATLIMNKYTYDDLITVVRDADGNIQMLQTNTRNINQIISDIPVSMVKKFEEEEYSNIYLHFGSILGSKYFSARGPKLHIRITNVGNVETKLQSEFFAKGINQTLHRVYLELNCEVTLLTPYNTIKEKISNQVLIAESVIVGNVPSSSYNLQSSDAKGDSLTLIN